MLGASSTAPTIITIACLILMVNFSLSRFSARRSRGSSFCYPRVLPSRCNALHYRETNYGRCSFLAKRHSDLTCKNRSAKAQTHQQALVPFAERISPSDPVPVRHPSLSQSQTKQTFS